MLSNNTMRSKTRFDFLWSTRSMPAAKNLLETVNDMNDGVKERFKLTFEATESPNQQMFGRISTS